MQWRTSKYRPSFYFDQTLCDASFKVFLITFSRFQALLVLTKEQNWSKIPILVICACVPIIYHYWILSLLVINLPHWTLEMLRISPVSGRTWLVDVPCCHRERRRWSASLRQDRVSSAIAWTTFVECCQKMGGWLVLSLCNTAIYNA